MTREERKRKIAEIKQGEPIATGTKLKYMGTTRYFDVFRIPIEYVVYNIENGRISSLVKSYNKEYGPLADTNEEDLHKIEKFLFESSEERNKRTKADLITNGQLEPGIITADGVIVDGNRRACLLRQIRDDERQDQAVRDQCAYFNARILPEDADSKEILRLETTYQMSTDSKVDYNPIEKYLHAKDMIEKGFTSKQVQEYMGLKSEKEVMTMLEVMDLIDDYLVNFDYEGIYTRMPRGFEDDLLKLNQTLKAIQSGSNKFGWIPQDKKDQIIIDVKSVAFDFIRLDEKGDFDYRALFYTSNGNILQYEETWEKFIEEYNKAQESIPGEKTTDEVLSTANTDTEAHELLNNRDREWKQKTKEPLMDAYRAAKNDVDNRKESNKPASLLRKAKSSLASVNIDALAASPQKEEITLLLSEIKELTDTLSTHLPVEN